MRKFTNQSIDSNTSSTYNEIQQKKLEALMSAFMEMEIDLNKDLSKEEILDFLDNKCQKEFDRTLAERLFNILDLDNNNSISPEEFMKGYLNFENDIKKNNDELNLKFKKEKSNLNEINNQCLKYQKEELNEEGFSKNALITVHIYQVEIKKKVEGMEKITIKVEFIDEIQETTFEIWKNNEINQKFEFKPKSRNDKLDFIMSAIIIIMKNMKLKEKNFY